MKKLFLAGFIFTAIVVLHQQSRAQAAGSLDLLNHAKELDGKEIVYKGEVIGDIMKRGDHAWLHVNDGYTAVGIWVPEQITETIAYTGDYQKRGDTVEVFGIFHRSCLEHGGDLDIHAQTVTVTSSGAIIPRAANVLKILLGTGLFVLVLLLYAGKKLRKK